MESSPSTDEGVAAALDLVEGAIANVDFTRTTEQCGSVADATVRTPSAKTCLSMEAGNTLKLLPANPKASQVLKAQGRSPSSPTAA